MSSNHSNHEFGNSEDEKLRTNYVFFWSFCGQIAELLIHEKLRVNSNSIQIKLVGLDPIEDLRTQIEKVNEREQSFY